ncbi:MAG: hypothetical protein ACYT04_47180 [Nostoc sp.]
MAKSFRNILTVRLLCETLRERSLLKPSGAEALINSRWATPELRLWTRRSRLPWMKQEADPLKKTLVEWLTLNKSSQVLYSSIQQLQCADSETTQADMA